MYLRCFIKKCVDFENLGHQVLARNRADVVKLIISFVTGRGDAIVLCLRQE
jgi:uncharacterized membrane protein